MPLAAVQLDLPPLDLGEVAAIVGVLAVVGPAIFAFVVWAAGRFFVPHKTFWRENKRVKDALEAESKKRQEALDTHSTKTQEAFQKHFELIEECRNNNAQSDKKSHELLHAIKSLSSEVSEQKQVTRDNTAATNRLSEKLAVIQDRQEREASEC